jgi:hypothetical protein
MDPAALWIRVQKANKSRTLRIRIHNTGAKDPDPHHFGMQDPRQTIGYKPDTDPQQSQKQDRRTVSK